MRSELLCSRGGRAPEVGCLAKVLYEGQSVSTPRRNVTERDEYHSISGGAASPVLATSRYVSTRASTDRRSGTGACTCRERRHAIRILSTVPLRVHPAETATPSKAAYGRQTTY